VRLDEKRGRRGLDGLGADAVEAERNWKTSSLYFAPVLMRETHSTTLPSGMPRP
jgi:hypothetical protein